MSIFIPGNVPSSKNSKRWTGKMLINSKTTMRYISKTKGEYLINKRKFKKLGAEGKVKAEKLKQSRKYFNNIYNEGE